MNRRSALKLMVSGAAATAAGAVAADKTTANAERVKAPPNAVGMLYDATLCVGCKACVVACSLANGLKPDTGSSGGLYQAPVSLNDGFPWGLWIAFNVVVGTALATGGYAIAILTYVLNRGRYHPLIRSALLTSALGYTLGGVGVILDLGRFYNVYKLPILFWEWNLHSVLLEVALCITLYTLVLWVEVSPAFLEKWKTGPSERLRRFSTRFLPGLERALPWLIALGLLLPTMHQSSLGSLMLLAGPKLHPLWQTPLLPLLFLISCIGIGYSVVVVESALSSAVFKRPAETSTLASLTGIIQIVLWLYIVLRLADIALRGHIGSIFAWDRHSLVFFIEMALFLAPAVMILRKGRIMDIGFLFRLAILIILAGALYRFSTFLIAFHPGGGYKYFPAVTELLITVGLVSAEIMAYIIIVKRYPILAGGAVRARARADAVSAAG